MKAIEPAKEEPMSEDQIIQDGKRAYSEIKTKMMQVEVRLQGIKEELDVKSQRLQERMESAAKPSVLGSAYQELDEIEILLKKGRDTGLERDQEKMEKRIDELLEKDPAEMEKYVSEHIGIEDEEKENNEVVGNVGELGK